MLKCEYKILPIIGTVTEQKRSTVNLLCHLNSYFIVVVLSSNQTTWGGYNKLKYLKNKLSIRGS